MNTEEELPILDDLSGPASDDGVVTLDDAAPADKLPQGAVRQGDGSVVYALLHPVTLRYRGTAGGAVTEETLDRLHLHRLNGRDMRAVMAAKDDAAVMVACARAARMNEARWAAWFDRMDGADAAAIGTVVAGFLERGRPTGR